MSKEHVFTSKAHVFTQYSHYAHACATAIQLSEIETFARAAGLPFGIVPTRPERISALAREPQRARTAVASTGNWH